MQVRSQPTTWLKKEMFSALYKLSYHKPCATIPSHVPSAPRQKERHPPILYLRRILHNSSTPDEDSTGRSTTFASIEAKQCPIPALPSGVLLFL